MTKSIHFSKGTQTMNTDRMQLKCKAPGFSIVEILVTLLIFSLVIGAIYGVFQSQNYTYSLQAQVAEMEQNARAASNMLIRELRMAGYKAMGSRLINNLSDFVPSGFIPAAPYSVTLDANPKITAGAGGYPDMITFLSMLSTDSNPTTLAAAAAEGATNLTLSTSASAAGYSIDDILHIGTASEYAKIAGVSGNTVTIDTNPSVSGNQGLEESYVTGAEIGEISVVSYAVFNDANDPSNAYHTAGVPALKRKVNSGGFQPLAENIQDMQITALSSGEIQVTITARTEKADPGYPENGGYRTFRVDTRIKVRNAEAVAAGSMCVVPGVPTNVTLIDGLNTTYPCEIYLRWDAVTTDANGDPFEEGCELDGYRIYYDTSAGTYGHNEDVGVGSESGYVLDVSSVTGCTYYVSVAARNSGGLGAKCTERSITDTVAPPVPTNLSTSTLFGNNLVDISWDVSLECDIRGYHAYRAASSGGPYTKITANLLSRNTISYRDMPLKGCAPYYYVVTAEDACPNVSAYSAEQTATPTDTVAPQPVTNLSFTSAGNIDNLSWTLSLDDGGGTNDVANYKIFGDGNLIATLSGGTTTYSLDNAPGYKVYGVSVVDEYCGNESEQVLVTTCANPPTISISNPADGGTVAGTVTIQGTAACHPDAAISGVRVQVGSGSWETPSGTGSWSYDWDTTTVDNGLYTISAMVTDNEGCIGSASITVIVNNETAEPSYLKVDIYACKPDNTSVMYVRIKVTDQNGVPVTGATVTGSVSGSAVTFSDTGSESLEEIDSENLPGWYGGSQDAGAAGCTLTNVAGLTVAGTEADFGGVTAKTVGSYNKNASIDIIARKLGYYDGVSQINPPEN